MKNRIIVIKEFNKIAPLVNAATRVDGDVAVKSGRWIVDARSLMGVMSLAVDQGVTVEYPDDATEFEAYLDANF